MTAQECTEKIQELINEAVAEMVYDGVDLTQKEIFLVKNQLWRFVKHHNQLLKKFYQIGE